MRRAPVVVGGKPAVELTECHVLSPADEADEGLSGAAPPTGLAIARLYQGRRVGSHRYPQLLAG